MKKFAFIIVLFMLTVFGAVQNYGQAVSLTPISIQDYTHRDYSLVFDSLAQVFERYSKEEVLPFIAHLKKQGEKAGDLEWVLESEMVEVRYFSDRKYTTLQESIVGFKNIIDKSVRLKSPEVKVRAYFLIFRRQWYSGDYEDAFQSLLKLESLLETIAAKDFDLMAIYLYRIGEAYYFFHD